MKKLVIALAAAAALTSPALAADMAAKAPLRAAPVAYAPTWTGCYVGGGGGYGLFDIETQQINIRLVFAINRSVDQGGRGWIGTLQAGCDYQFPIGANQFVVGAFGDYNFSNMRGDFTGNGGRCWLGQQHREGRLVLGHRRPHRLARQSPDSHLFLWWLH